MRQLLRALPERINASIFNIFCQLKRKVLIYPAGRDRKPGIENHYPERRDRSQRSQSFPYSLRPRRTPIDKKGHISAQRGGQRKKFGSRAPEAKESIEAKQRGRGIAAPPTQARPDGNPLADANVNGTLNPLFAEQERGGLIGEVTPSGGDHGMVAEHLQASLTYLL